MATLSLLAALCGALLAFLGSPDRAMASRDLLQAGLGGSTWLAFLSAGEPTVSTTSGKSKN